jgi:hypothetical protein
MGIRFREGFQKIGPTVGWLLWKLSHTTLLGAFLITDSVLANAG